MSFVPITKYEKAKIIGTRATQIANGAKILTDYKGLHEPISIALKEFNEGMIPINIIRVYPNGKTYRLTIKPKK